MYSYSVTVFLFIHGESRISQAAATVVVSSAHQFDFHSSMKWWMTHSCTVIRSYAYLSIIMEVNKYMACTVKCRANAYYRLQDFNPKRGEKGCLLGVVVLSWLHTMQILLLCGGGVL